MDYDSLTAMNLRNSCYSFSLRKLFEKANLQLNELEARGAPALQ
jgi:hypothetical protein